MGRPKILLLGSIVHAHEDWSTVASQAEVIQPKATSRQKFVESCRQGDFDGVVVIYRTFYSVSITGLLDDELLQSLPPSLKFICHSGAGYDQIDIPACHKRGVQVSNVPTVVNDATADTAIFLMLGALRGFAHGIVTLRNNEWRGDPAPSLGHDPQGKVLGILGCGGIGRNLAKKASPFGMTVIYHNRTESEAVTEAKYVDFTTLLKTSDVIAVGLPLNRHTRHALSDAEFDMMKRGVVIVNPSRGPIINEAALVNAMKSGKVWSCGLDVFEQEPSVHPYLISHPRAMLLPHLGTYTVETHTLMEKRCIANVLSALTKGSLQDPVLR